MTYFTCFISYSDYIASGRSLDFIEEYICKEVLPLYGNTHTTSNTTANQTTSFRNEARNIIRKAVNASETQDAVIFTGSGCTSAIHKLINALYLEQYEPKPLVLVTGQEHHSNLIPWREAGCEIITINELPTGQINLQDLESKLSKYHQTDAQRTKIGLFTAASNVSGILNDDLTPTALMHQYQGLAFWDYATAAPYVKIDMNPRLPLDDNNGSSSILQKDAIYFSMHKFPGGPQTPGILVAKTKLFENSIPHQGGGGTVVYVTQSCHKYVSKVEEREEGGTPAIIESIRSGLVMLTKETIGIETIMSRENLLLQIVTQKLKEMSNLVSLGPMDDVVKLPIFSFLIKCPSIFGGKAFLHHNFVCQVLNDLFGIQARGGCACAGPYVEHLLGMTQCDVEQFTTMLDADFQRVKPGFTRLGLPWFSPKKEIMYILEAIELISKYGWSLLPQYEYNHETAEWRHKSVANSKPEQLKNIHQTIQSLKPPSSWKEIMIEAKMSFANAKSIGEKIQVVDDRSQFSNGCGHLRWFILPYEAKQVLLSETISPTILASFWPKTFSAPSVVLNSVGSYNGHLQVSPILAEIIDKHSTKNQEAKNQETKKFVVSSSFVATIKERIRNILFW